MEIIIGRQGTQKTPITDPSVSRKHCKVTDNGDGTYTIENLSPSGTKVDGVEIVRTTAKPNSRIQFGQSFSATLVELIGAPQSKPASQPASQPKASANPQSSAKPQQEVKTFNISHLKKVWEDFNQTNLEMADARRKTNLVRAGGMIFTMGGGVIVALTALPTLGLICSGVGIVSVIYSFAGMKNEETAAERQRRQDAFDDAWVCPNPDCNHSLLAKNYRMLVKNHKSCPYCKCNYVEK